jgi:hypothetical protein
LTCRRGTSPTSTTSSAWRADQHQRERFPHDIQVTVGTQYIQQLGQGRLVKGHRGGPWCGAWQGHTELHAIALALLLSQKPCLKVHHYLGRLLANGEEHSRGCDQRHTSAVTSVTSLWLVWVDTPLQGIQGRGIVSTQTVVRLAACMLIAVSLAACGFRGRDDSAPSEGSKGPTVSSHGPTGTTPSNRSRPGPTAHGHPGSSPASQRQASPPTEGGYTDPSEEGMRPNKKPLDGTKPLDRKSIIVAGPTLSDEYPAAFGWFPDPRHPVRIHDLPRGAAAQRQGCGCVRASAMETYDQR